jgi:hypothetical protein
MDPQYSQDIPTPTKIFGWILVAAGIFFAYVYAITPGAFFPVSRCKPSLKDLGFTAPRCGLSGRFWGL